MADHPPAPYSARDYWLAIALSAIFGWAVVVAWIVFPRWDFRMIPVLAMYGLPFSTFATLLIGGPILFRLMRRPIGWGRAAKWGTGIAATMASLSIVFGRLNGYRQSLDPTFDFQIGGGDFVREVDGILTPYGWQVLAQNTLIFIALGAGVGLIVRWVIGPGRT